jgi:hypothetical protein
MEESLFRKLSEKYNVPNPLQQKNEADTSISTVFPSQSTNSPDYATLLSDFYKRHNPGKISEVNKTLVKYKVSFSLN